MRYCFFATLVFCAIFFGSPIGGASPEDRQAASERFEDTSDWLPLTIKKIPQARHLKTALESNHQGPHTKSVCTATLDREGALHIGFPIDAAYHLETRVTIKNGKYQAFIRWVPINSGEKVKNDLVSVNLALDKNEFKTDEVINGYIDLVFSTTWLNDGTQRTYFVRGPFSAMARNEYFNPYDSEYMKDYDPDLALHHLENFMGENILYPDFFEQIDEDGKKERHEYAPASAWDFTRKSLFKEYFSPEDKDKRIREMSWYPGMAMGGPEQITIWFRPTQKGQWEQIGCVKRFFRYVEEK